MLRERYNQQLQLEMGTSIFSSAMWQLTGFYIDEDLGLKKPHSGHLHTVKVPCESHPSQWHEANLSLVLVYGISLPFM